MTQQITFANDPDAAYALYDEVGVFVEPDVFTAAECDEMIAAAMKLGPAQDGTLVPVMQVHRQEPLFLKTMGDQRLLKLMDKVCHGRVSGIQTQLYYTPPGRAGLGFHQDNYFVEAPDDSFASAWVPLVDITPENGGLYAFKGSHKQGKLPVRQVETDGKDKRQTVYEETVLPEDFEKIDIFVKRGAAVLIHGYNVHGSYQNQSGANRMVILNTYVRAGVPFRAGNTAKREEVSFART